MSTTIRPEVSTKNKYWIEKHRYYELKHFCLQYPTWKKAYQSLDGISKKSEDLAGYIRSGNIGDPTAKCAEAKAFYSNRISMVEQAAIAADPDLYTYILKGVTEGITYEKMRAAMDVPCCKDSYYNVYRKFFYILDQIRE